MKKITLVLALIIMANTSHSQAPVTPTSIQEPVKGTKAYYLEKREANMVRGWILTPTGFALGGLGWALAVKETTEFVTTIGQDQKGGGTAALLMLAGVGSVIVGTISFVSARSNKRKARSLEVGYEQVPLPQHGAFMTKAVPTVGLNISF